MMTGNILKAVHKKDSFFILYQAVVILFNFIGVASLYNKSLLIEPTLAYTLVQRQGKLSR